MSVIYREYRPRTFDDVIGLDNIKTVLKEQVSNKKVSHAYLFSGPRGTGKTSMARLFARKVNNFKDDDNIESIDIIEIDAASNRGIEEIRDLKAKVNFVPTNSRYKIYIIDEVHMLTKEAFNALLKTLEEPPKHIIFILATTEPHKIPMTILSRVTRFDFRLASRDELTQKLRFILEKEGIEYEKKIIDLIVNKGKGSFRDMESILDKVLKSSNEKIKFKDVQEILGYTSIELVNLFLDSINKNNLESALKILKKVEEDGKNLSQFTIQVLDEARIIMYDLVSKKRNDWNLGLIAKIIKEFSTALLNSKNAILHDMPFEIALINLLAEDSIIHKEEVEIEKKTQISNKKKTKQIKEPIDKGPRKIRNVDMNDIQEGWNKVLDNVKSYNHHLTAFLTKSKLGNVEENIVTIKVPFEFHKKKLEDPKSKEVILKSMRSIWSEDIDYVVEIETDMAKEAEKNIMKEEVVASNKDIVEGIFNT